MYTAIVYPLSSDSFIVSLITITSLAVLFYGVSLAEVGIKKVLNKRKNREDTHNDSNESPSEEIGIKKSTEKENDNNHNQLSESFISPSFESSSPIVSKVPSKVKRVEEAPVQDTSQMQDKFRVGSFIRKHKSLAIGYAVWFVIHCTFLLFGEDTVPRDIKYASNIYKPTPKDFFFPFTWSVKIYDSTEFFVYLFALPVVAYAIYYFIKNGNKDI